MVDRLAEEPSTPQVADRLALRDLVYAYAHAVDNRLPNRFRALFCGDGQLVLPHPAGGDHAALVFDGSDGWARAFAILAPCTATTHFVGNQLVSISGDSATGETHCLAHEHYERDGANRMLVRCVRYADSYRRVADAWLFHRRELTIDWVDDRALVAPPAGQFASSR
jgi:SnoaL-like protein